MKDETAPTLVDIYNGVFLCVVVCVFVFPGSRVIHQVPQWRPSGGGDPDGRTTTHTAQEVQRCG